MPTAADMDLVDQCVALVGLPSSVATITRSTSASVIEGVFGDPDVVGGRVRAGVPGPQHDRQRFTGALTTMVDERAQWMKPVAPLVGGGRLLFVGVGGDQVGVQIDDQRLRRGPGVARGLYPSQRPGPRAGRHPSLTDTQTRYPGTNLTLRYQVKTEH